jgi:acetyltransferase-like isoleucine patch superfamily enzyme
MIIYDLSDYKKLNKGIGKDKVILGENSRITSTYSVPNSKIFLWETIPSAEEDAQLIFGKYCSIASGCTFFLGGNHIYERTSTWLHDDIKEKGITSNGNITIGNDVWVGFGVTIMSGVTIGDGVVIAANANIVKDIEPYSIIGGNPAKLIKKRFSDEDIEFLLKLRWWDWTPDKIEENKELLFSGKFDITNLKKLL